MVDVGLDLEVFFGDSIELVVVVVNVQGFYEIIWFVFYDGILSCEECEKLFVLLEYIIDYEVYVIDENGCDDIDRICVFVKKLKLVVVFMGFILNGDLMND